MYKKISINLLLSGKEYLEKKSNANVSMWLTYLISKELKLSKYSDYN